MTTIEKLGPQDLPKLVSLLRLYADVFEMDNFSLPAPDYLQSLLTRNGLTFLVAISAGEIVGGLTAHDLPSAYFPADEVYLYDLAVSRKHQRQGIGRQLLTDLGARCSARGSPEFFLEADLVDTGAIEFYRATGGLQEKVTHFSFPSNA